jgi:hypothetical protein
MARIFTYDQDPSLNLNDKLIGTNSEDNVTKNFTIQSFLELANNENFIKHFDGIVFKVQDYNVDLDQYGIITTGIGTYTNTDFANIQTIYLSDKNLKNSDVGNYIDVLSGYDVRITNKNDVNNFGIYRVDNVVDSGSGTYKILTLTNQDASGQLQKGDEYYVSTLGNNLKNLNSFSVTSTYDVTDAGSGRIITDAERTAVATIYDRILYTDVQNNLESTETSYPLSANQGKILKGYIDTINTTLTSDNVDLDTLQEVVDFIEANKDTLDSLTISNIAGLQTALDGKVDVIVGKGLSTEDFTTAFKTKLQNIADGAEVNVQADWDEINTSSDAFIANKPTDITNLISHSVTELSDISSAGSGYIITSSERSKLAAIDVNAEQNVQADWNVTDTNSDAFIANKPVILDQSTTITVAGTANQIATSPNTPQNLTTDRTFTVSLANDVTIPNNLTVTNDLTVNGNITLGNQTSDTTNISGDASIAGALDATSIDAGNILSWDTAYSGTPTQDNAIYFNTENSHDILNFRYHGHTLKIDTLTEVIPSGITSGGTLSAANTTQFTINAGTGIINDLNKESGAVEPYPEIKYISWSQSNYTVFNLDANDTKQKNAWIYVDENGSVQQQATAFTDAQITNKIIIGSVVHSSGTIDFVKTFPVTAYGSSAQIAEFARMFGPMKKTGHKITANGANRSIDRSAGTAFAFGRNYTNDPNNPSIVADAAKTICSIHRYYSDGLGGHVKDTNAGAGYTTLDPTNYDASGTLTAMNTSKFSVQRLYFFPTTPNVVVAYYGKGFYNSIEEAEKSYLIESFEEADNTATQAIYLGSIVLKGDATALNNTTQAKILTAGIFRSLAAVNIGGVAVDAVLNDLVDVNVSSVANDNILKYNGTSGQWENTGGYNNTNWDTAYGWGDHSTIGYLTTETDPVFTASVAGSITSTQVTNWDTAYSWGDHSTEGYLTSASLTETDPVFVASEAYNITSTDTTNWDTAYGWGDHSLVGYLTSYTETDPIFSASAAAGITSTNITNWNTAYGWGDHNLGGYVDTANSPGANEFARFTDANTIEGRTASEIKADLSLEIGVDVQAYDADLTTLGGLAKTDGNFIVANGTTWVAESGNTARTSLGLGTSDNPTFNNLTVSGNLTISGTTTTVNTETINLADNIILINSNATTGENGGIQVERGSTGTDASLIWDETNDYWKAGLVGSEYQLLTTNSTIPYSSLSGTPTIPTVNNGTLTVEGTGVLGGSGTFTANDSSSPTISITHDAVTRTNNNSTASPSHGGTFTAIDSITTSTEGHVTAVNTKTITLPSDAQGVTSITAGTGLSGGTITSTGTVAIADGGIDADMLKASGGTSLGAGTANYHLISNGDGTFDWQQMQGSLSAGNGIDSTQLSSNVIQVLADQRDYIEQIGFDTNNYYVSTSALHTWYFGGSKAMEIDSTNKDLIVAGDVIAYSTSLSDVSLKDNIITIDNALSKVEAMRGVEFDWNSGSRKGNHDIGVVAQEVEKILPEIVYSKKDLEGNEVKTVDYEKITAVLIEAVKELSQEVKELKKQINA